MQSGTVYSYQRPLLPPSGSPIKRTRKTLPIGSSQIEESIDQKKLHRVGIEPTKGVARQIYSPSGINSDVSNIFIANNFCHEDNNKKTIEASLNLEHGLIPAVISGSSNSGASGEDERPRAQQSCPHPLHKSTHTEIVE